MKRKFFDWRRRRKVIYLSLLFCACEFAYLTVWGVDSMLNVTIATSVAAFATLVANAYILGAAWQDVAEIKGSDASVEP